MGEGESKEVERKEETPFPLAPSPHESDSAADDLWRALSSGVIGRHVASQCGNESIRVGTLGKILPGWQFSDRRRGCAGPLLLLLQRGEKRSGPSRPPRQKSSCQRATSDVNNAASQRAKKRKKEWKKTRGSLRRASCSGMSFKYASG